MLLQYLIIHIISVSEYFYTKHLSGPNYSMALILKTCNYFYTFLYCHVRIFLKNLFLILIKKELGKQSQVNTTVSALVLFPCLFISMMNFAKPSMFHFVLKMFWNLITLVSWCKIFLVTILCNHISC